MNTYEPMSPRSISKEHMKRLSDDLVLSLVSALSQLSEKQGIPPPRDYEDSTNKSFTSNESSLFLDEFSLIADISDVREKNQELKRAVKETVKAFKSTSKKFLSRSILISDKKSLLVNELENVKNFIVSAIEEQRDKSFSEVQPNTEMQKIHDQINDIQSDIKTACLELAETEEVIKRTDEETTGLQEKLKNLDVSLGDIEIEDEERHEACTCVVI